MTKMILKAIILLMFFSCQKNLKNDLAEKFDLNAAIVKDENKFKVIFKLKNISNKDLFVNHECNECFKYKFWILKEDIASGGPGGGRVVRFNNYETYILLKKRNTNENHLGSGVEYYFEFPVIENSGAKIKVEFEKVLNYYVVGDVNRKKIEIKKEFILNVVE